MKVYDDNRPYNDSIKSVYQLIVDLVKNWKEIKKKVNIKIRLRVIESNDFRREEKRNVEPS